MPAPPGHPPDPPGDGDFDPLDEDLELLAPDQADEEPTEPEPEGSALDDEGEGQGLEPADLVDLSADEPEPTGSVLEDEPQVEESDLDAAGWTLDADPFDGPDLPDDYVAVGTEGPEEDDTQPGLGDDDADDAGEDDWGEPPDDGGGELSEDAWASLEDEGQSLPAGRALVGLKEFVALPQLGLPELVAWFDTSAAGSALSAPVLKRGEAEIVLQIAGAPRTLVLTDGVRAALDVEVGGATRRLMVEVVDHPGPPELRLGLDAMEGYFVVDVAQRFLHSRGANRG